MYFDDELLSMHYCIIDDESCMILTFMHAFLDGGPVMGLRSNLFDDETPAQEGYDPMMRGSRFYGGNLGVVNL